MLEERRRKSLVIFASPTTYSYDKHELQQMLQELPEESENKSKSKTKVMMENDTLINICQQHPDRATSAWDRDSAPETNTKDKEIQRRITAGWTAFANHRDIFKGNIGTCLKR